MNWFQRHLNWTAVIVPIVGGLLGVLILKVILGIISMPHIPGIMGYYFDWALMIDIADIFSIIWFRWILKRKNRSWAFLLFFVPPLIPFPDTAYIVLFLVPFWLAGWIILLTLKNKSANQKVQNKSTSAT